MKMGFLLKNNARKRMGEKGVLKKGEEKEAEKGREKGVQKKGEKRSAQKRERKRWQKKASKIREF